VGFKLNRLFQLNRSDAEVLALLRGDEALLLFINGEVEVFIGSSLIDFEAAKQDPFAVDFVPGFPGVGNVSLLISLVVSGGFLFVNLDAWEVLPVVVKNAARVVVEGRLNWGIGAIWRQFGVDGTVNSGSFSLRRAFLNDFGGHDLLNSFAVVLTFLFWDVALRIPVDGEKEVFTGSGLFDFKSTDQVHLIVVVVIDFPGVGNVGWFRQGIVSIWGLVLNITTFVISPEILKFTLRVVIEGYINHGVPLLWWKHMRDFRSVNAGALGFLDTMDTFLLGNNFFDDDVINSGLLNDDGLLDNNGLLNDDGLLNDSLWQLQSYKSLGRPLAQGVAGQAAKVFSSQEQSLARSDPSQQVPASALGQLG
jgi:hypothetical protein